MLHSILRSFSVISVSNIGARLITFLFYVYAARSLGPEAFGQFLLIGTYVMFAGMTFMAGLMPAAVRELVRARDHPWAVFEQLLSLRLVLGLLAYVILLLVAGFVLPAQTYLLLAAIAGTSLVFDAFKASFTVYYNSIERLVIPGVFEIAAAFLSAAIGALLLYLGFGVAALLAATALVDLALNAVWHAMFSRRVGRYRIRLAVSAWKEMLLLVAPFAPMGIAIQFTRLANVMMLSLVRGPMPQDRAVGFYGPPQQIANFPLGFLFAMRRAMVPPVAERLKRGERIDEEYAVALKISTVFFGFPILVATSMFAEEILFIMFGAGYLESALALKFLGGAAALAIIATFPETFVASYRETKITRFLPGAVVPLLFNVGLCWVLIPTYGVAGAAFAYLVTRGVHLGFFLYYSRAVLPLDSLGLARMLGPLTVLCVTFAGCLLVSQSIDGIALRALTIIALAVGGIVVAGRRELSWLWIRFARRRASRG